MSLAAEIQDAPRQVLARSRTDDDASAIAWARTASGDLWAEVCWAALQAIEHARTRNELAGLPPDFRLPSLRDALTHGLYEWDVG